MGFSPSGAPESPERESEFSRASERRHEITACRTWNHSHHGFSSRRPYQSKHDKKDKDKDREREKER